MAGVGRVPCAWPGSTIAIHALFFFLLFFSKCSAYTTTQERRQHAVWMGHGLPLQLTPCLPRPRSPSRTHSGVFSPTFSPAQQGCSLAEKWTWLFASFLYLSRVSQCLAVPCASSDCSLVTAQPGSGGNHSALLLWLKGSFQCPWHVPPAPFSVCLSH